MYGNGIGGIGFGFGADEFRVLVFFEGSVFIFWDFEGFYVFSVYRFVSFGL